MENNEQLRNGLGIASFVLGILGFLTGFIVIGMFFDVIAIILGVIAIISKKNKNELAIAGIIIASVGLITMIFLFNVFDDSNDKAVNETPAIQSQESNKENTNSTESKKPTETKEESEARYEITDTTTKTWVNSIGTTWTQTIVEITNTGSSNLYLSSGSYDLEDAEGNLITNRTMVSTYPNVLAPGEKGYMYEETVLDDPVDGELIALPRVNVKKAKVDLIRFPVTDVEISDGKYGDLKMIGRVENTSEENESMVYVVAFLYDSKGSCIGQMFTILMDDLKADDKIGFKMSGMSLPDDVTSDSVADYVVFSYPIQFQFWLLVRLTSENSETIR